MENTAITLHVDSITANEDVVQTPVLSKSEAVRFTESTTSTQDAVIQSNPVTSKNEENGLTASVTSNKTVASSPDQTLNNNTPATVSVNVNSGSSQKPDTILFMVINTNNNKCVSVFIPLMESRDLQVHWELSSMTVYAYGLQRQTNHALEWYTVLSHSHLSIASSTSFQQIKDVPKNDVLVVQMPALRSIDIRKCLPFSAKKSIPANVIQDKWMDAKYTFTGLPKVSGMIFIQQVLDGSVSILVHSAASVTLPFPLRPARDYDVHHMEITQHSENVSSSHLPTERLSFRTKMSKWDVSELYRKADCYLNVSYTRFEPLPYLYRNKSPQYFDDIFRYKNGWMNTYIKNDGGDPASVLNGRINGLFFSAVLQESTGLPPPSSPFGSERLFIPTLLVFNDKMNLYFADFYCHSAGQRHKVTLVLTVKGSEEDTFCSHRLVYLDLYDNPFFFRQVHPSGNGLVRPVVTVRAIVEIFLTMNLNIDKLQKLDPSSVYFRPTEATTSGTNMVKGIPKCPTCNICNLSRFCS